MISHQAGRASPPPLVAVVDDDQAVREALPDLLREFGFATRAFASAEELLAFDDLGGCSCLILDIAMPGMTGLDLQRELRRRGHGVPVIFITAQTDEAIRVRAAEEGATGVLLKPFGDAALLSALNAALGAG